MRIIFICGGAEPFCDGVGDYSRALACELRRNGIETAIIALGDNYVNNPVLENQQSCGLHVQVFRVPSLKYIGEAKAFADGFKADVFSLQYVPYGFHPKGLPAGLGKHLLFLAQGAKWHIMYHELWVGLYGEKPRLKIKILGLLQRTMINQNIATLQPALINTSLEVYKKALQTNNIEILPLFGNINIAGKKTNEVEESFKSINTFKVIHFGTFTSYTTQFLQQLTWLHKLALLNGKRLVLYICGSGGPHKEKAMQAAKTILKSDEIVDKGKLPDWHISQLMLDADFGISRADFILYGKSGSTIAMIEHGLPVLLRGTWPFNAGNDDRGGGIYFVDDAVNQIPGKDKPRSFLPAIGALFLKQLEKAGYKA